MAGGSRVFTIINGDRQGSVSAARKTTYMIDECTLRYSKTIPREFIVRHREVDVPNEGFVDDELLLAEEREGSVWGAKQYTKTLDELAMTAHPKKSVQILCGDKEWVQKTRSKLKSNPCKKQKKVK